LFNHAKIENILGLSLVPLRMLATLSNSVEPFSAIEFSTYLGWGGRILMVHEDNSVFWS